MVKYTIEIKWKDHSINLESLEKWLRENAGEHYCGNSADINLRLHFLEEPSEDVKDAIMAKMEELDDPEHEMCKSYMSHAEKTEAKKKAKESAIRALADVSGLSKEQVEALLG